nr:MAG TPA: hypothetical protein [Caudoviricetes sp.]
MESTSSFACWSKRSKSFSTTVLRLRLLLASMTCTSFCFIVQAYH